ncbi:hypothetical protein DW886_15470 [Enterocloster aldenensis]|uniref:hypothetical protein n=1 Tax=Enterocloster aldenensis TaxID=358742 RepID=UPI000E5015BC|nr:hypothetical protein DW886_15470 [Enterocloster aldenensis]
MNYLRKKCTQGGTTLLLSNDQETLKQYVLTELKQMESLSIPCCIISYNEICDNEGQIERTSDLNPFININIKDCIKDNHKGYLWMLASCLLTLEYSRKMTDDENRKIKEVCDKLDFTKDELPMSELFDILQPVLSLPDQLQHIYHKLDSTVETIKNRKDFYCESSDPTLLFYNFVYTMLSLKEVYTGTRVWIYTDLLQYIQAYDNVIEFLQILLSELDHDMFTINFMITKDTIIPLFWSDIRFIKRLDGPDSFLRYKDYYNISQLQWKYSKVIAV